MARQPPTGRSTTVSMTDFNARAKRISESTGTIAEGGTRRTPQTRWRKNAAPPPREEPEAAEVEVEAEAEASPPDA